MKSGVSVRQELLRLMIHHDPQVTLTREAQKEED